ncbi:MAG: hypothetical protein VX311_14770 [Planctomycetota bacterium]|nr:hypothetical protein [Planctomycetota bacterium]
MKHLVFCGLMVGLFAGCAELREGVGDSVISIKTRTAASAAWKDSTEIFKGIDNEQHFADGFKAGYFRTTIYGMESLPSIPNRYSGSAFRTRRGQQRIQAWRDGYAHGSSVAMEEVLVGVGSDLSGGLETVGHESATTVQDDN